MLQSHHRQGLRFQEFQDLETIHSHRLREWVFLVRWLDLETIHSTQLRVWQDQVHKDLELQDLEHDLMVHRRDLEQDQLVLAAPALDSVDQNRVLAAALPVEHSQPEVRPAVADAALAAELLEHSVRAALAEVVKLASPSVPREKNSNKEVFQALVAQLCHAAMEPRLFVCAGVHQFKISRTRLTLTLVS
jgi:hypothetical protein